MATKKAKKKSVRQPKRRASKEAKAVKTMLIEYSSNNSGGGWWLKDADWVALERAGWHVEWGGTYFCHSKYSFDKKPKDKPEPCKVGEDCPGHRRYDTAVEAEAAGDAGRWLGAIAKHAEKAFETPGEAMREFEQITGQTVSDEGCNCCGAPHGFSWPGGYASGEDCLSYLFPGKSIPRTLRETLED